MWVIPVTLKTSKRHSNQKLQLKNLFWQERKLKMLTFLIVDYRKISKNTNSLNKTSHDIVSVPKTMQFNFGVKTFNYKKRTNLNYSKLFFFFFVIREHLLFNFLILYSHLKIFNKTHNQFPMNIFFIYLFKFLVGHRTNF